MNPFQKHLYVQPYLVENGMFRLSHPQKYKHKKLCFKHLLYSERPKTERSVWQTERKIVWFEIVGIGFFGCSVALS